VQIYKTEGGLVKRLGPFFLKKIIFFSGFLIFSEKKTVFEEISL